jgi:hypothetical protein
MKTLWRSETKAIRRRPWLSLGVLPVVTVAIVFALPSASIAVPDPIGMECTTPTFVDEKATFDLETATGHVATPDGNSVFMWGFTASGDPFQMPGPVLCVDEGDMVEVTLENTLSEAVSIVFPGQSGVGHNDATPGLLTGEADPSGGTVSYSFTASQPGTYLYESGTNPTKQVQMGLYGALVVRPAMGANFAYNDGTTRFDPSREYLILLNEIDPTLHRRVELGLSADFSQINDDYWQVNGRSFPDTIAENHVSWLPSQPYGALVLVEPYDPNTNRLPALIRYLNAGVSNHPFHPHGNHLRVIARDGRTLRGPAGEDASFEDFTRTIGSGQTYDLLFRWDDVDPWITGGAPVPVTIPGLQNLVFKDDVTFYSGDPRLGQQDELPPGVTSFNQCGEFYFPWHSHALFEFTNFDEGFGGLATVLRVDPAGGCPAGGTMHIGDLDGTSASVNGNRWRATVTVTAHTASPHAPVSGVTLAGQWSQGDGNGRINSCTTDENGQCNVVSGRINNAVASATFTVSSATHVSLTYQASDNHDPDSDSNGTSITVNKP